MIFSSLTSAVKQATVVEGNRDYGWAKNRQEEIIVMATSQVLLATGSSKMFLLPPQ